MNMLRRWLKWRPAGFTLVLADGTIHIRIRGDMVPADTLVIVEDGRYFVAAHAFDGDDFAVYREGYSTFMYQSSGG